MYYKDFICKEKNINNNLIVFFIKKYLNKIDNIILLDGRLLLTSKILKKNFDVNNNQINVSEIDKTTYVLQRIANNNICTLYNNYLYETLKKFKNNKLARFNVFYFDYTCTLIGNKTTFPMEDINFSLSYTKHKKIIFALTFSPREGRGLFTHRKNMKEQMSLDYLEKIFTFHKFKIIKSKIRSYKRTKKSMPMVFFLYYLKKDIMIDNSNVDFSIDESGNFEGFIKTK
jgi:hypothetical protein